METPQFIELRSPNMGVLIINTSNILYAEKSADNACLITFKEPVKNYRGIEFYIRYAELSALLQAKIR
jgi:hypothetical protein